MGISRLETILPSPPLRRCWKDRQGCAVHRPARLAAPHPARTIAVVSQGRVGRITLSPNPADIPPSNFVPAQILSVRIQTCKALAIVLSR